ncbi:MAG TPA: LysR family transcriptional regulator [Candidatus Saccharimonadia bacterium]|nr:LysR family transcriptional regulator [Candidatus Saccharimonadia bacterium]
MELYQLRTFLTVAEEGNLTRAAEKLFTSQPAVSAQVKALEDELGMKLFERSPKGMQLTQGGKALSEQAKRVVDAARDFKHSAEGLRGTVSGELVLGINNRPEILRLMEVLQELTLKHSDLSYDMANGSSGVIIQGLEEGNISIGFFEGHCESSKLTWHQLDTIELCLAAPAAWAEELSMPDWKLLESKPWIFVSPMCSYFRTIQNICREQGLQITPRFRVNEDLTVLNLVAEGLGVTLLAKRQIELHQFEGRVVPLPHFRAVVPLSIGYLTERAQDPAIMAVRDAVLEVWKTPQEERARMNSATSMPLIPPTRRGASTSNSDSNLRRR